jgi:O-acetylhomoserine/O-acetylserine sulfhydrylase-like pyridoxal-dependent enzyme
VLVFHTICPAGDNSWRAGSGGSISRFNRSFKSFGWHVVWACGRHEFDREGLSPKTKAIFIKSIANLADAFLYRLCKKFKARPLCRQHSGPPYL